jgi:hypothetical protein
MDEDGVPAATGVSAFDPVALSPLGVDDAGGTESSAVEFDSFDAGVSPLMEVCAGANCCKSFDDSFSVTILVGLKDFRRAAGTAAAFVVEDMVRWNLRRRRMKCRKL